MESENDSAWRLVKREHDRATSRYEVACRARDEFVASAKAAGATWGELAAVTGLDRAQLVRMAARHRARTGNDSHLA